MKSSSYIKKVKESEAFKEFMKEDPKAYLCSLFFTRDLVENRNESQVDFYSPQKKTIVSFKAEKKVERAPLGKKAETLTHKKFIPKPLNENIKMDVDEIEPTLTDEMHNRGMTYQIEKVLAFANITDGEVIWNCTAFLKGLGLLMAHVEDKTNTVLYMEKKSFFDLLKFSGPAPGALKQGNLNEPNLQISEPKLQISEDEGISLKKEDKKKIDKVKKDGK